MINKTQRKVQWICQGGIVKPVLHQEEGVVEEVHPVEEEEGVDHLVIEEEEERVLPANVLGNLGESSPVHVGIGVIGYVYH